MDKIIFTVGHSNRDLEEFLNILKHYNINCLVDVRRFPSSKRFPHFNKNNLKHALLKKDIDYYFLGNELGGFRKGGYENYIKSDKFKTGMKKLLKISRKRKCRTVIMCTELLFFKCHRRYISDVLTKLGYEVVHVFDKKREYHHKLRIKV